MLRARPFRCVYKYFSQKGEAEGIFYFESSGRVICRATKTICTQFRKKNERGIVTKKCSKPLRLQCPCQFVYDSFYYPQGQASQ
ncbi:unnamed protein product [Amoebophrya sp. A120]|nr:unnamed protein product [Amoebophrya sp. A120]|eukprot:GSA120T00013156001.1